MANPTCPECEQGKHDNCNDTALDLVTDKIVTCGCYTNGHQPPVLVADVVLPPGLDAAIEAGVADGTIFADHHREVAVAPLEGEVTSSSELPHPGIIAWVLKDVSLRRLNTVAAELAAVASGRFEVDLLRGTLYLGPELGFAKRGDVIVAITVDDHTVVLITDSIEVRK